MGKGFPTGNFPRATRWCRVEEDEYIADVNGSVTFATTAFPVNPGQAATFPWLSKQAAQWEKYYWEYLEFYYKPEVSAFAQNGAAGKVILSMDYDAADAPPSSKQQAEDTDPHADAMPYEDLLLQLDPYEMFQMGLSKYVRPGGLPGSTDIKTYDSGNLSVSTIANVNATLIGELHVRYAVVFEVPVLESSAGGSVPANNQVAWFMSSIAEPETTGVPLTLALATAEANGIAAVNTAGSIVPPAGNYLVDAWVTGSAATAVTEQSVAFEKNGAVVGTQAPLTTLAAAAISTELTVGGSWFVTCNGTDALKLVSQTNGTGGTVTAVGSLRIVAI